MSSYPFGKSEVCAWVRRNFPTDATVLDVGPCDGTWKNLLPEYENMDAVEAFGPNMLNLGNYREAFHADVRTFDYDWYDLIIFGDVIEHMSVEDAQKVLKYAWARCKDMIVAVPFLLAQDAIYGNPYEIHVQDDLTAENFKERYPGFAVLWGGRKDYCYYHKEGGPV